MLMGNCPYVGGELLGFGGASSFHMSWSATFGQYTKSLVGMRYQDDCESWMAARGSGAKLRVLTLARFLSVFLADRVETAPVEQ